jgi:periplasmic protein TonB
MKIDINRVPGLDDLLFASRNREYGAYQLRKKYNAVVIGGIIFASLVCSAAVILPFVLNPPSEHIISGGSRYVQVTMENLKPPEEDIYIPTVPPPPKSNPVLDIVKYVPPVVVDTIITYEKPIPSNDELIANTTNTQTETNNSGHGNELISGDVGSGDGDAFFLVEIMPSFRGGGLDKFRDWIKKRTNYPQEAIDKKIRGTVFLSFVVEKDGSVSNINVIKGVNPLLDNEAVKAISESPKWTPGLQRGQPVRVRYLIPLSFNYL